MIDRYRDRVAYVSISIAIAIAVFISVSIWSFSYVSECKLCKNRNYLLCPSIFPVARRVLAHSGNQNMLN